MIRKCLFVVPLLPLLCGSAQAQTSLSDQINAVNDAQVKERVRQEALEQAAAEQAARVDVQQRATQAAIERRRSAAQQAARGEAMASKKRDQDYEDQLRAIQIEQARVQLLADQQKVTTDKKRDQAYEDQLRALEIQQKTLELKRMETRASRESDFIDRDLKNEDAKTDVIQSGADATRALSDGSKTLMQDAGTAAIKKESGFFSK
jgi:hypothetical protein